MLLRPFSASRKVRLVCGIVAGVLLPLSRPALAIVPPQATLWLASEEFPEGGVVTGDIGCALSCTSHFITIVDAEGQVVSGRLAAPLTGTGSTSFVWIADEPLALGDYSARVGDTTFGGSPYTPFRIVEATTALPQVESSLSVWKEPFGDPIRCIEQSATQLGLEFYDQVEYQPLLSASAFGANASQYEYALVLPGDEPESFATPPPTLALPGHTDEVCYELVARSLVDATVVTLDASCLPTSDLALGVMSEPYGSETNTLGGCVVPPEGYFDGWCQIFASAFAAQSCVGYDAEACFAARRACPEGDEPTEQDEEAERAGTMGSGGRTGDQLASGGTKAGGAPATGAGPSDGGSENNESGGNGENSANTGGRSSGGSGANGTDSRVDPGEASGCSSTSKKTKPSWLLWLLLASTLVAQRRRLSVGEK